MVIFCAVFLAIFHFPLCLGLLDGVNTPTTGELLSLINQLNQTIQKQNTKIAALEAAHQSTQVAFSVSLSHTTQLGDSQIIQFDHVVTNVGNRYDARHGHFIANYKGIYVFTVSVMSNDGGHPLHVQLVKNGINLANVFSDTAGLSDAATTVFVEMNVGDMVWVKHMSGVGGTEGIYGYQYCHFGGALINKM